MWRTWDAWLMVCGLLAWGSVASAAECAAGQENLGQGAAQCLHRPDPLPGPLVLHLPRGDRPRRRRGQDPRPDVSADGENWESAALIESEGRGPARPEAVASRPTAG